MGQCAFCQAELSAGTRFCRQCGHAQPSMLLTAPAPSPRATLKLTHRCPTCGEELPEWARFCGNCRSTQPLPAVAALLNEPEPETPKKRCATCGEEAPLWARFCGVCGQLFAAAGAVSGAITVIGPPSAPFGMSGALMTPPVSGELLPGMPGVPVASGAPQAGAPGVPVASAGPQAGAPGVPSAPAGPQGSAPGMPHAPVPPHSGTMPWQASTGARVAGKGALRGLRYKLLGTTTAKIIAAAVATTVLLGSGGATAAYFLTRPKPVIQVTSAYQASNAPAGSPTTVLHVTGQEFSESSTVSFQLDGKTAPGTHSASTDAHGALKTDLTVTEDWRYGFHTLTATDAQGYTTKSGVRVDIIPRPVIQVMSQYQQGGAPAGSASTSLHISGVAFSYTSPITFLLDGQPTPGSQRAESDARGRVEADLAVTGDWKLGAHTLTANDAQGYATPTGMPVAIVAQGEASTPGPNGAPADDASFGVMVNVDNGQLWYFPDSLVITGKPDPNGGTVCQARDNGQTFSRDGPLYGADGQPNGITYHETTIATCAGSYKGGHLIYTETATSDQFALSNGVTCQGNTPRILQSLDGSFDNSTTISGSWSADPLTVSCDQNFQVNGVGAQQASWSGSTG